MSDQSERVNSEALQGQGEFSAKIAPAEPLLSSGHQPGRLVGNDSAPTFSAQVLPAGSAPADKTFQPNPDPVDQSTESKPKVDANDFPGATSADVHTGLGKPIQGQSSKELHDNTKSTGGLEGLTSVSDSKAVDARDPEFADQRALDKENAKIDDQSGGAPANERIPETAETVASEN